MSPTYLWFLLCLSYLFNGIRFQFVSREFPAVRIYIRVQSIAAARGTRQTDGQTDSGPYFIMPLRYGGLGIITNYSSFHDSKFTVKQFISG